MTASHCPTFLGNDISTHFDHKFCCDLQYNRAAHPSALMNGPPFDVMFNPNHKFTYVIKDEKSQINSLCAVLFDDPSFQREI